MYAPFWIYVSALNLAECFARQETLCLFTSVWCHQIETRYWNAAEKRSDSLKYTHIASYSMREIDIHWTNEFVLLYRRSSAATCLVWDSCSKNSGNFCGWYHLGCSLRLLSLSNSQHSKNAIFFLRYLYYVITLSIPTCFSPMQYYSLLVPWWWSLVVRNT